MAGIIGLTVLLYARVSGYGFTNLDDDLYLLNNPWITSLSWENIKGVFTSFYLSNYHPVTTLSYAVEYGFFGLEPGPYHVINLLIHIFNIILVTRLLLWITKSEIISIACALLFAVHPMHVESVSWVSERKDVLYAFFYLCGLMAYLKYLASHSVKHLAFCGFFFIASLLSKSMAVTLPVILLLIDYYKGRKFSAKTLLEKAPFFALSIIIGVVAIKAQQSGQSIGDIGSAFTALERFFLVSYAIAFYIMYCIFPLGQSVMHYYPEALAWFHNLSPILLLIIMVVVIRFRKIRKELLFGFGFFLVSVAPVLQLIPVGNAIVAERYTYLPYLGLFLTIGIALENGRQQFPAIRNRLIPLFALYVLALAVLTWQRIPVWKNSIALFSDVIETYPGVFHGHFMRGSARLQAGDFQGALADLNTAAKLKPEIARIYTNRGMVRRGLQDFDGAISDYDTAIRLDSSSTDAYNNRGSARAMKKDYQGAIADYDAVIQREPNSVTAFNNRGNARLMAGDFQGAASDYTRTIQLQQAHANAWYNRGVARMNLGMKQQACADWQMAAQLGQPNAGNMMAQHCGQ